MKDLARSALEAEDIEVRIAGFKMLERYDPDSQGQNNSSAA